MEKQGSVDALFMTKKQLETELLRCEYCEEKPCKEACPANCSPFDFIMAARVGNPSDIKRSAGEIMHANPLGGVCGLVCPDRFCMAACSRKKFDGSINIPQVQATLVEMAKSWGASQSSSPASNGKKSPSSAAVPRDLGAASALGQLGYSVDIFEKQGETGRDDEPDPDHRLDKDRLETDIEFLLSLGQITAKTGTTVEDPKVTCSKGI